MRQPEWRALHEPTRRCAVVHWYGEALILADAASRGYDAVITDVAAALGIKAQRIPLSQRAWAFLREAVGD
eukprot:1118395-Pleurochrysis_carterae.AAC.1